MSSVSLPKIEQIQRAIEGDVVELTLLLKDSRRALCAWIAGKIPHDLKCVIDAEDCVQDAHVEAFRQVDRLEARTPDSFDRWLATIAVRKLRDAIKRFRAAKRGGGIRRLDGQVVPQESAIALFDLVMGSGGTPSRVVAREEAIQAIESALAELPAHYHQAVRLIYLENCSVTVAAVRMSRTERSVHGLCRRGLQMLRDRLGSGSLLISALK